MPFINTRPDMVISAQHLLDLERMFPGRISLIGDTLPNAIRDKPPEWFERMPTLREAGTVENFAVQGYGPNSQIEVPMAKEQPDDGKPDGVGFKMQMSGDGHVTQPWEKRGITEAEWRAEQIDLDREDAD